MSQIQPELCETHIIGDQTNERIVSQQACQAFSLYRIHLVGISDAHTPFRFIRPHPDRSQLLACITGQGLVWLDGKWVRCAPGMAYLTPPGAYHAYYALEPTTWKICWVSYQDTVEQPAIALAGPVMVQAEPHLLAMAIEGLYSEYMKQAEQATMQQWAQLIYTYAQRMIGPEFGVSRMEPRLQRVWAEVNEDLAFPWTGEQLADLAGISTEHMRRLCLRQTGHSPMRYLTLLRMRRAMALLASESYSVEAVAFRVGYENAFAFSTAFKRYAGVAPSTYRQNALPTSTKRSEIL